MASTKKRFNFTPDLKEYIIRSRISEDKKYFLPTPENLLELFNLIVIQGQIEYDIEKYKSFFKIENEENILDLTNIQTILNNKILNSKMIFMNSTQ